MIFTVASGAAIDRQTPIPNVHYVDEEWYIKENSHLISAITATGIVLKRKFKTE